MRLSDLLDMDVQGKDPELVFDNGFGECVVVDKYLSDDGCILFISIFRPTEIQPYDPDFDDIQAARDLIDAALAEDDSNVR